MNAVPTSAPRSAAGGPLPSSPAAAAEIPFCDWLTLGLRGGRHGAIVPNMGWRLRFPTAIGQDELEIEAARLAANPYGLGRRAVSRRITGGRPRWRQQATAPPVRISREAADDERVATWTDDQLAQRLDPEHGAGWRLAAITTEDGGTVVLLVFHHVFGSAHGLLRTLYGDGDERGYGTTERPFAADSRYDLRAELDGVGERLEIGLRGLVRLALELAPGRPRRAADDDIGDGAPPPLAPPSGPDPSRRPMSDRRVSAFADVAAADWDAVAARHGGTGNSLLTAVAANLLRRTRAARGGPSDRPLRMLLPIDLGERRDAHRPLAARSSTPTTAMATAKIVVPGGAPEHGDLRPLRARMKAAFVAEGDPRAARARGAAETARLLPEGLLFRLAAKAALHDDGCASNVGRVPEGLLRLGAHRASSAAVIGMPFGNEAIAALTRFDDRVALVVVTDPVQLPADDRLRPWLADELAAWSLPARVW